MVVWADGKIVTGYHFRSSWHEENFIGVTIWEFEQKTTSDFNGDGVINRLDFVIFVEGEDLF